MSAGEPLASGARRAGLRTMLRCPGGYSLVGRAAESGLTPCAVPLCQDLEHLILMEALDRSVVTSEQLNVAAIDTKM